METLAKKIEIFYFGNKGTFSIVNLSRASLRCPRIIFVLSSGMVDRWILTYWGINNKIGVGRNQLDLTFLFDFEEVGASDMTTMRTLAKMFCYQKCSES